jgi:hypothetical protein
MRRRAGVIPHALNAIPSDAGRFMKASWARRKLKSEIFTFGTRSIGIVSTLKHKEGGWTTRLARGRNP